MLKRVKLVDSYGQSDREPRSNLSVKGCGSSGFTSKSGLTQRQDLNQPFKASYGVHLCSIPSSNMSFENGEAEKSVGLF
ncbi:hypothetical protein QVD17_18747 [Tagetes erecta]|uniref:Uncharacterized protein n=1 Tax=Tagetes erecta TaxID=13708 RepID=A0AAD8KIP3_TARER|nr:hypothetical protein QVD17_18747 [Tagetes erecta]